MSEAKLNKFFITGTSSGIGKALAELLLKEDNNRVEGISRKCSIEHQNYVHKYLDLSKVEDVSNYRFEIEENTNSVYLVNNAGWLGEVAPLGGLHSESISRIMDVNLVSPLILMNTFVDRFRPFPGNRTVLNISSGAAKYPVKSWSGYCSSKAALDMASEVLKEESPEVNVYSIAPGIVDTEMQKEIRNIDKSKFADVDRFINYHQNNELRSAEEIALKLYKVLIGELRPNSVVSSLRD